MVSTLPKANTNSNYIINHLFQCIYYRHLNAIRDGIGEKVSMFAANISTCLGCIIAAFAYGWKLCLVLLAALPIISLTSFVLDKVQASTFRTELKASSELGGIAEEVLSSIRTVFVFDGKTKEMERFQESVIPAQKAGIKRGLANAVANGLVRALTYFSYALGFWYGTLLVTESCRENNGYTAGSIINIMFNITYASAKIGQALPFLESFSAAREAAVTVFRIIDRTPDIDSSSKLGTKLANIKGDIEFKNVKFHYPSRPDVTTLNNIQFRIPAGKCVALVGASGCGKSTCIQLIQRFYDSVAGEVTIDGVNVKNLNVAWLREQIGIVGQEPILFATTIGENIKYGKEGATQEEVEQVARQANAHAFIEKLPLKYETLVGERGAQLSGGQKQRIAIARALIRNPTILLFDEATSALDTRSEAIVQSALDQAAQGRTTIIVAHRLTTVRRADKIIVLSNGFVQVTL